MCLLSSNCKEIIFLLCRLAFRKKKVIAFYTYSAFTQHHCVKLCRVHVSVVLKFSNIFFGDILHFLKIIFSQTLFVQSSVDRNFHSPLRHAELANYSDVWFGFLWMQLPWIYNRTFSSSSMSVFILWFSHFDVDLFRHRHFRLIIVSENKSNFLPKLKLTSM